MIKKSVNISMDYVQCWNIIIIVQCEFFSDRWCIKREKSYKIVDFGKLNIFIVINFFDFLRYIEFNLFQNGTNSDSGLQIQDVYFDGIEQ